MPSVASSRIGEGGKGISKQQHKHKHRTFDRISRGNIHITANDFPRFLFKSGAVYNKDDIEEGILEGHLLFRVRGSIDLRIVTEFFLDRWRNVTCKVLPRLARLRGRRANRGNVAKMHVKKFTPRLIAYIAFQVRNLFFDSSGANATCQTC
jgi:hypothetical protein